MSSVVFVACALISASVLRLIEVPVRFKSPPLPLPLVSTVILALSEMVMSEPSREMVPPLPTPLVWAVIRLVEVGSVLSPLMVSFLSTVPILMSPPLPRTPMPVLSVWAFIKESLSENEMVRSRGVKVLMLISVGLGLLR